MLVPGVGAATGLGGASVCAETSTKAPANATEIDAIATAILQSESREFTTVRGYRLRSRRLRARQRSARQSDYAVITDDRIRLPGHTRARREGRVRHGCLRCPFLERGAVSWRRGRHKPHSIRPRGRRKDPRVTRSGVHFRAATARARRTDGHNYREPRG